MSDETRQNIERNIELEAIVADLIGALRTTMRYADMPSSHERVADEALSRAFAFQAAWVSTRRTEGKDFTLKGPRNE